MKPAEKAKLFSQQASQLAGTTPQTPASIAQREQEMCSRQVARDARIRELQRARVAADEAELERLLAKPDGVAPSFSQQFNRIQRYRDAAEIERLLAQPDYADPGSYSSRPPFLQQIDHFQRHRAETSRYENNQKRGVLLAIGIIMLFLAIGFKFTNYRDAVGPKPAP